MIFFQGLDDKVVPPPQSEVMVEALRRRGVPVAYLTLEGEGHGFRKADSIVRTLEAELVFLSARVRHSGPVRSAARRDREPGRMTQLVNAEVLARSSRPAVKSAS
jgi:acetyl esterase/lipase